MINTIVELTPEVERELKQRVRSGALRADDVRRARLILMLADGESFSAIRDALGCNRSYITRWKTDWRACIRVIPAGKWRRGPRSWKRASWPGRASRLRTGRRIGAVGSWRPTWERAT